MKSKKNILRKVIQSLILILFIAFSQSCDTEIPPEDLTPPEFSFQIQGDGFHHVFKQDSDYNNLTLNLKTGATFEFTYTAIDNGGLARASWSMSDIWKTRITTSIQSPWSLYADHNAIAGGIEWRGNSATPLTGALVTGFFEVSDQGTDTTTFTFRAVDFGGEEGMHNQIQKSLRIRISDSPTRILP